MAPHIRPLTDADAHAVLALNEAVVDKLAPMDRDLYRWFLSVATVAWAAEVEGQLAGFVLVLAPGLDYPSANYRWFSQHRSAFWYLDRVAVADAFRRRGVGTALYDAVEAEASRLGCPVLLEVNLEPRNDGSLAFHAARGYQEVGTLRHDDAKLVVLLERSA